MRLLNIFLTFIFIYSMSEASEKQNLWKNITLQGINNDVNFHAWGGSKNINNYIKWAGIKLKKKYGINLKHIKVTDTAQVAKKVFYEKIAKKDKQGSVDLMWINGENF